MSRRITPHTTLDNLKKESKRWLKQLRASDTEARERFERAHAKTPAPKNPGLRELQLKTYYAGLTKITDRSLEILGRMLSLESIEFYETKSVTDAGLRYLAGLPRLREIDLGGLPNVTLEGTKVFPPHVRVDYHL